MCVQDLCAVLYITTTLVKSEIALSKKIIEIISNK